MTCVIWKYISIIIIYIEWGLYKVLYCPAYSPVAALLGVNSYLHILFTVLLLPRAQDHEGKAGEGGKEGKKDEEGAEDKKGKKEVKTEGKEGEEGTEGNDLDPFISMTALVKNMDMMVGRNGHTAAEAALKTVTKTGRTFEEATAGRTFEEAMRLRHYATDRLPEDRFVCR